MTTVPDPTGAQEFDDSPLLIPRLSGPIVMDGRVDEAAWEALTPLGSVMHLPTFLGEPTEDTEFRIGHDGQSIFFSCRMFDSHPEDIRALSLQRDATGWSSDWCALTLDTFLDGENSLLFGTTPAGLRLDIFVSNDAQGPASTNVNWNTFWDAEVSRDDRGWYAEMRIPLTSLRFHEEEGTVRMGMSAVRSIARKNEHHSFPAISPEWGGMSPYKASQTREVVLEDVRGGNPLYVTPYALGGTGYSHSLDAGQGAFVRDDQRVREIGGDLKYGLTQNLTLDISLNTDFAQVETDNQRVNLTRFSLFFPEKRSFFQERSGVFNYSLGGNDRLFHSRRIGLSGGRQIPIYGGARVVGRIGEWDIAFLDMHAESPEIDGSSENMGVLRVRRRIFNANSYVGGIATTRLGNAGTRNTVYGADAILRLFGQDYLTLNFSQSFEPEETTTGFVDRSYARFFLERRGLDGLTYALDLIRAGETFEPGLGFLLRRDYSKGSASMGQGWRMGSDSPWSTHRLTLEGTAFSRNSDNSLETATIVPQWSSETKEGHRFVAQVTTTRDDLERDFSLDSDTEVPAGLYTFTSVQLQFRQSSAGFFRVDLTSDYGAFYDGRRSSNSITATWNPSMYLELVGTYRLDDVDFEERDQHFRSHLVRLRTEVRLNTELTGAALVQFSSVGELVSVNLRVRYNPSEGHDLYIVWNEGYVTDRFSSNPVRPLSDRRQLLIKYSKTFTLGT